MGDYSNEPDCDGKHGKHHKHGCHHHHGDTHGKVASKAALEEGGNGKSGKKGKKAKKAKKAKSQFKSQFKSDGVDADGSSAVAVADADARKNKQPDGESNGFSPLMILLRTVKRRRWLLQP